VHHNELPPDSNKIATDVFFTSVENLLLNNISLIAEAAFQHKVWESRISTLKSYADVTFVLCDVNAETAASRHLQRGLADQKREYFHGDNRVTHFKKTGELLPPGEYIPPTFDLPIMKVDTEDGYDPSLDVIVRALEGSK
jgi:hypothetical protein